MIAPRIRISLLVPALLLSAAPLAAQTPRPETVAAAPAPLGFAPSAVAPVPFGPGERAEYDVRFGPVQVGSASMYMAPMQEVRGINAWHAVFTLQAKALLFGVNDVFESWTDPATFNSLRFYQTQEEGAKGRVKRYEIYPERGIFVEMDRKPPRQQRGVRDPLDDGSFLYFVRTLPLVVGRTYEFDRYFRPDRNPVTIRVLRKEVIQVPAGRFNAIVVQPIIRTSGIFSENGRAQVWLSDDDRRIVLQVKSTLSFGSINLFLRAYRPAPADSQTR